MIKIPPNPKKWPKYTQNLKMSKIPSKPKIWPKKPLKKKKKEKRKTPKPKNDRNTFET